MVKRNRIAVTITRVVHHRNGVGGLPFNEIAFTYEGQQLVAVLPDEAKPGECFVIDPSGSASCWRGDQFQVALVEALKNFPR
jgi:hypothetical protein